MPEKLSKQQRSHNMGLVKGRDTKPELAVRSMLHKAGFRFRVNRKDLPGKPDIVLPARQVAMFVHGCFWHSHSCKRGQSSPQNNSAFWAAKRRATVSRDDRNEKQLQKSGWTVITLWECSVNSGRYQDDLLEQLALFPPLERRTK